MVPLKARIDAVQLAQAGDEQGSGDHEHECERHLEDDN
jgi:hypothetical protein